MKLCRAKPTEIGKIEYCTKVQADENPPKIAIDLNAVTKISLVSGESYHRLD
jgi:hypothetical protein